MVQNSQIHLFLETELLQSLKMQARNSGISLSKLCRKKLGEISQIDRIEVKLGEIEEKLNTQLNSNRR